MRLKIDCIWSPDLNPPSEGLPPDVSDFSVFMQVALAQRFHRGREVFQFFVRSPTRSRADEQPSLGFERFDWLVIRERVAQLIDACRPCKTWDEVVAELSPSLEHSDR